MALGTAPLGTFPLAGGPRRLVELGPVEIHASASVEAEVIRSPGQPTPGVSVGLAKMEWEATGIGLGALVGGTAAHTFGAVVGGVIGWLWALDKWRKAHG
jgi:hypothetical protein